MLGWRVAVVVALACLGAPASAAAQVTPAVALAVPASAQVGQTVTYQASVAGDAGMAPTGSVVFKDNGVPITCDPDSQSLTPEGGTSTTTSLATCTVTITAAGQHPIAATYSGDVNYDPATTSSETFTADPTSSTTTLSFAPSNPVTNQPVTLTASVAVGAGSPTGRVAFSLDGSPIVGCQDAPLTSGTATCPTVFDATESPATVTATYKPDSAAEATGSTSLPATIDVTPAPTSTTVRSSVSILAVGQTATYTATVTPGRAGPVSPTGTVGFADGGNPIAGCMSQPLSAGGTATCSVRYTTAHAHAITATYGGDGNFSASPSYPPAPVTVASKPPPSVSATTHHASHLSTTAATLNGTLVTGGQSVEWQFQYGTSEPFTHATPLASVTPGHGTVSVSRRIAGLRPGTAYRYELIVIIPAAGAPGFGQALSFITKPVGKLRLPFTTLTVTGKTAAASIRCQSKSACQGRFAIATRPIDTKAKTLSCGSASYRIAANQQGTVTIKLTHACLAQLTPSHKKLAVTVTATPSTGQLPIRRATKLVLG